MDTKQRLDAIAGLRDELAELDIEISKIDWVKSNCSHAESVGFTFSKAAATHFALDVAPIAIVIDVVEKHLLSERGRILASAAELLK